MWPLREGWPMPTGLKTFGTHSCGPEDIETLSIESCVCLTLILGFFFTHRVLVLVDVRAVHNALLHARKIIVSGKGKHVHRGFRLNAHQEKTARVETQKPMAEGYKKRLVGAKIGKNI